jgi:putative membrane protein
MIDETGHKRVVEAIDTIDQKSDGEIYCLVANDASQYREVPLAWGALAALLVPPVALELGLTPDAILNGGWTAQDAQHDLYYVLSFYALAQALLFGAVALIASIDKIRMLLTPRFLKNRRVRKSAAQHFVSTGIHLKETQPHVLIFVAMAERQVEIIADETIHAVTGAGVWEQARDVIVAGMNSADPAGSLVRAVEIVGAPLVQHFPATASHPDINANGVGRIS